MNKYAQHTVQELIGHQADLLPLQRASENIDITTATGKMLFSMLGVMTEFERDIIGERTSLAMQAKKAKGEYVGDFIPYGYQLASDGKTFIEIPNKRLLG